MPLEGTPPPDAALELPLLQGLDQLPMTASQAQTGQQEELRKPLAHRELPH